MPVPEGRGKLTAELLEKFRDLFRGAGYDLGSKRLRATAQKLWGASAEVFQATTGLTFAEFKASALGGPELSTGLNRAAEAQAAQAIQAKEVATAPVKAVPPPAPKRIRVEELTAELRKLGVPKKEALQTANRLHTSSTAVAKAAGGMEALPKIAREVAPVRTAGKTGLLGWMAGLGGKTKEAKAIAELTKGVGSPVKRMGAKALRGGLPMLLLSGLFRAGDIKAGLGFDKEFTAQMGALEGATTATTSDALLAQYEEEQLLAQGKARLMRSDPMAMQFLMSAMEGGIPQKLTANEIMIGAQGSPAMQGLAGDEITRALMGT